MGWSWNPVDWVTGTVGAIGDFLNGPESNPAPSNLTGADLQGASVTMPTVPTTFGEQLNEFMGDMSHLIGMSSGSVGGTSGGGATIVPSGTYSPPTYTPPSTVGSTNTVQMGDNVLDAVKTGAVIGMTGAEVPALVNNIINGGAATAIDTGAATVAPAVSDAEKAARAKAAKDAAEMAASNGNTGGTPVVSGGGGSTGGATVGGNDLVSIVKNALGGSATDSVVTGLIGALSTYFGANSQSEAAKQAAQYQSDAAQKVLDESKRQFDITQANQQPWLDAGKGALTQLNALTANPATFSMNDFQADPGYDFRLSEGIKAIDRSAAARGGLLSGATLKGTQQYGQNLASDEYQNAFNRYQSQRTSQMNNLQSLAGLGQTSTQALSNASQNYANTSGDALTNIGNANSNLANNLGNINASAYQGYNNALTGALNRFQSNNLLNKLLS